MRALAPLLLLLTGCSIALPTPTPDPAAQPGVIPTRTWVGVHVPADWVAPPEMSLEVGGQAWSITADGGAGVVSPDLSEIRSVRLVGVDDCHVFAAFEATPGAFYAIRFADDGSVSIEEVAVMEAGPGLRRAGRWSDRLRIASHAPRFPTRLAREPPSLPVFELPNDAAAFREQAVAVRVIGVSSAICRVRAAVAGFVSGDRSLRKDGDKAKGERDEQRAKGDRNKPGTTGGAHGRTAYEAAAFSTHRSSLPAQEVV